MSHCEGAHSLSPPFMCFLPQSTYYIIPTPFVITENIHTLSRGRSGLTGALDVIFAAQLHGRLILTQSLSPGRTHSASHRLGLRARTSASEFFELTY